MKLLVYLATYYVIIVYVVNLTAYLKALIPVCLSKVWAFSALTLSEVGLLIKIRSYSSLV